MNARKTQTPPAPITQTPPAPITQTPPPIPGLEVVGRGIYLRPRQPYEVKEVLFKQDLNRTYYSREVGQIYAIPEGYEVSDSPPMPANQSLNKTLIEESWERFDKQLGLSTKLAASNAIFSIDVNSNQTSQLRSNQDSSYALRSSFIPLWSVYLPGTARFPETLDTLNKAVTDVPLDPVSKSFSHNYRREYEKFFDRYGTHYVKRAWIGGTAMLTFSVAKSSNLTKEEIQAGIQASFGGLGSGGASTNRQVSKEKLQSNSECKVFGKGGDEPKLAMLSSLDEASFNAWMGTIKDNPQVIEFEVAGIWTLITDQAKADALQEAYSEATTFKPLTAIFSIERSPTANIERKICFVRNDWCFYYNVDEKKSGKPMPITDVIKGLQDECTEFQWPDASFTAAHLGENLNRKAFLFKRDKCIRVDVDTGQVDEGYPKSIKDEWPGVEAFDRIDAVVNAGPDSVYFFRGNQYIRFNTEYHKADEGYPALISERWVGVFFERIDAAIYWGNSKIYFFRNNQYIRYDMSTRQADAGYPKLIPSNYVEDLEMLS